MKRFELIALFAFATAIMMSGCAKTTQELDGREAQDPLIRTATAKEREGDKDTAILMFRRALDKNPNMGLAHLKIALLYDDHDRDYARAIYHYQRYLELRPDTEKRDMLLRRISGAEERFCAALSKQHIPFDADCRALREENIRLKQEIRQVRQNMADMMQARRKQADTQARAATPAPSPPAIKETADSEIIYRSADIEDITRAPKTTDRVYIVQQSDTLSSIASTVYENPRAWRKIYDANRDVIGENPAVLKVGQELIIPDIIE